MLKVKNLFLSCILFFSIISGCGYKVQLPEGTYNVQTHAVATNPIIVGKIKEASKNMSPEDRILVKKMCKGYSSFIQSTLPETVLDAFKAFQNVQTMYGWDDIKKAANKDYCDALEAILGDLKLTNGIDYEKPHDIKEVRENLKLIFESIAEGV